MNLASDLVFMGLLSIIITAAVWALEKLPMKFTTDQRPAIAQVIGALGGLAYSFAPVYEFLNRNPVPADATPATYIIGGWWAGLAAIGLHQTAKRAGIMDGKNIGVGMLVLTIILGGAGVSLASCAGIAVAPANSAEVDSIRVADRAFVLAGQAFDTAMTLAVDLRRARKIDDATWAKIDAAQKSVNEWSPKVATALEYWRTFGSRSSFDASYNAMMGSIRAIESANSEAQQ